MSEPLPESGLDFLVLSREQALALNKFLKHQYLHYDEEMLHDAARKIMEFADRNDNKSQTDDSGLLQAGTLNESGGA